MMNDEKHPRCRPDPAHQPRKQRRELSPRQRGAIWYTFLPSEFRKLRMTRLDREWRESDMVG